ncbi:putative Histidine kinase [Nostocoides japonicum T1-X7]|uniref:histidine kinase n=1 Tax=Nostocoides japonicum T1-X7 TaxID=1194083 RepID=A0A077LZ57_9MICO|nr:histidine kinase [Tetrasphaera japonica]CCH77285.1 putative Histidine kinase [Tetrasphaera japonica T1-X7]
MARLLLPRALGRLPVADAALAVALCVLAVGGLATGQVDETPLAVTVPIAAVSTLAMALRTRFPVPVAAVVTVLAVAQAVLTGAESNTLWALVVFLVSSYTVAAECDEGWALVGLALVLGGQFLCEWLDHGSDYPFDTLVFGGVWLFGRGTRSWRNQAAYAEQHRHDLARIAVAEERTRIARELHDVVAHSLSVIAVQADAAEAALGKDPARAAPPMRAIRDSARDALVDMRQLLHVLRTEQGADPDDDVQQLRPARGIGDLPQLVDGMRKAGLPLEADIRLSQALSSGLELAAFRIAQEGLTNVRKHAGDVPTRLAVTDDGHELKVEVRNEAPRSTTSRPVDSPSTGHGLVGVRERVQAAGGALDVGPTTAGGFVLVARLPLRPAPVDGVRP